MSLRKYAKPIAWTLVVILAPFFFVIAVIATVGNAQPHIEHADSIIVLGSAHPHMAAQRALRGLELYEEKKAGLIVLTGGHTHSMNSPQSSSGQAGQANSSTSSEAAYMETVIREHTSSTPDIILEDQSRNTYENLRNARVKIPDVKSIILVTDNFHVLRSVLVAKRAGFKKVYWSSPEKQYLTIKEILYYYPREVAALIKYLPLLIFDT